MAAYDEEDFPDEKPHYCEECNHWVESPLDHSPNCSELEDDDGMWDEESWEDE